MAIEFQSELIKFWTLEQFRGSAERFNNEKPPLGSSATALRTYPRTQVQAAAFLRQSGECHAIRR